MAKKAVHVVPRTDGGWSVKRATGKTASFNVETKAEVVKKGTTLARKEKAQYVEHKKDGTISKHKTFK